MIVVISMSELTFLPILSQIRCNLLSFTNHIVKCKRMIANDLVCTNCLDSALTVQNNDPDNGSKDFDSDERSTDCKTRTFTCTGNNAFIQVCWSAFLHVTPNSREKVWINLISRFLWVNLNNILKIIETHYHFQFFKFS